METPSPFTFHGVKGVGEAGTVGAYAAIPNAVADALRPWGIVVTALPLSPRRVWELVQAAAPQRSTAPQEGPRDKTASLNV